MNILASLTITWDWQFFALLPALNVNMHSSTLEFEWLFLGLYLDIGGDDMDHFV